jgi:hypothetical protein
MLTLTQNDYTKTVIKQMVFKPQGIPIIIGTNFYIPTESMESAYYPTITAFAYDSKQ